MAYLGRCQIGDTIGLSVCSKSPKTGAAVQPAALVQGFVYDIDAGTIVESVPLHPKDRFGGNWDFTASKRLSSSYTPGHYVVLYQYGNGGTLYSQLDQFEVVSGGDEDGQVIALSEAQRPEAPFVLYETESGAIKAGRNPS